MELLRFFLFEQLINCGRREAAVKTRAAMHIQSVIKIIKPDYPYSRFKKISQRNEA
jgi:hypothetical protein